jgi:hypothetical protein
MQYNQITWLPFELRQLTSLCTLYLHTNPLPLQIDFYENCIDRLEDLYGLNTNIGLIREHAIEVCLGLQPLDLPALVVLEIVDMACSPYSDNVRMASKWNVIVEVKHFRARREQERVAHRRRKIKKRASTNSSSRSRSLVHA